MWGVHFRSHQLLRDTTNAVQHRWTSLLTGFVCLGKSGPAALCCLPCSLTFMADCLISIYRRNPCCWCTTINFRHERYLKHLAQGCNHDRTIGTTHESNPGPWDHRPNAIANWAISAPFVCIVWWNTFSLDTRHFWLSKPCARHHLPKVHLPNLMQKLSLTQREKDVI